MFVNNPSITPSQKNTRKLIAYWIFIALILAIPACIAFVSRVYSSTYGVVLSNQQALNFQWRSIQGETHYFKNWQGDFALVFFGYLRCSDYCPSRLAQLRELGQFFDDSKIASNIDILFFTVDPSNDNQELLKTHIDDFPNMQSGYIDEKTLYKVTSQLKEKIRLADNEMSHTANLYLINSERKAVRVYNASQLSTQKIVEDVYALVGQ